MFGKEKGPEEFDITPVKQTKDGPGIMIWVIGILGFVCLMTFLEDGNEECHGAHCELNEYQRDKSLDFPQFD